MCPRLSYFTVQLAGTLTKPRTSWMRMVASLAAAASAGQGRVSPLNTRLQPACPVSATPYACGVTLLHLLGLQHVARFWGCKIASCAMISACFWGALPRQRDAVRLRHDIIVA